MTDFYVVPLSDLIKSKDQEELEPLKRVLSSFSCKKETDLEYFLNKKAIEYEITGYGKTFLIVDKEKINQGEFVVMAFFTTAQTALDITNLSNKKRKKVIGSTIPGRDNLETIPAYLIGQIGRDDRYSHNELPGHVILQECYVKIDEARRIVGGSLLLLECRPKMFKNFYEKEEFLELNVELNNHRSEDIELMTLYKRFK